MIETYVALILVLGLIVVANLVTRAQNETADRLFHRFLFLLNLPLIFIGAGLILLPGPLLAAFMRQTGAELEQWRLTGFIVLCLGVWGAAVTVHGFRALLARRLPLRPDSAVHTLALILAGFLIGNSLIVLSQGGLEGLAETATPASIWDVLLSQLFFALLGVLGVGLAVRRNGPELLQRLGLVRPQLRHLLHAAGWVALLLLLQALAGAVWTVMNPERARLLEDINSVLLQDMDSIGHWFLLAAATGIGEEVLFRGALQPALGIGFTAVLFALAHIQYGFTAITFFVLIMGVIFGYIRRRYSTTIAIVVHAGYNFTLGMIALLLPYLEELARRS
jgi:uncharacterized protein